MSLDFFYAPTPNGWKVTIMVEELREAGARLPETQFHLVDIAKGEQFSPEFTSINPNQKIPALLHNGRSFMESCAILQYLGEAFPSPLLPRGQNKWTVIQWLYWQAANLGPVFGNKLSYTRYIDAPNEQKKHPLERFSKEAQRLASVLDRQLTERPFICGDAFSVADISVYPWMRSYKWSKIDITNHQYVMAWMDRCRARPGVSRGVAYGVPEDEVDTFSKKRRNDYKKSGAAIASNKNLRTTL